jgi:hypothetical protein
MSSPAAIIKDTLPQGRCRVNSGLDILGILRFPLHSRRTLDAISCEKDLLHKAQSCRHHKNHETCSNSLRYSANRARWDDDAGGKETFSFSSTFYYSPLSHSFNRSYRVLTRYEIHPCVGWELSFA